MAASQPWRILFTGKRTGAYNMAVDAAVLKAVEENRVPPTLRFYGWQPWCLSLGYFQKPSEEFDAAAVLERGWDFVLRPTGGRAVLHAEEITYSLIARRDAEPWCSTLAISYEKIGQALAAGLTDYNLSLSVGTRHPSTSFRDRAVSLPPAAVSLPCFASTSRSELAFGERKVVGSAQRRTREAFLQHGSIPLTPDHERLVEVLRLSDSQREAYLESLRQHAISLSEIQMGLSAELEMRLPQVAQRMLESLGVAGEVGILTDEEINNAQDLEKTHIQRQQAFFKEAERVAIPS